MTLAYIGIGIGILFGAIFVIQHSCVTIPPQHLGIAEGIGGRGSAILRPGFRWAGLMARVYLFPTHPHKLTVQKSVVLPDGSEVVITASLLYVPDDRSVNDLWKLYDQGEQLEPAMRSAAEAVISKFAASTSHGPQAWTEALESHEELEAKLRDAFLYKYGVRLTDVHVEEIMPTGRLATQNLMDALKEHPRREEILSALEDRVSTIRELESRRAKLREQFQDEPETLKSIDAIYRVRIMRLKEQ